ncbi:hypothetical protein SKAU_G00222300 [Synaphobranchus kaupii]|uniref:Membrane-spanning 4-domains subfamily A member 4A n=1 Tax=Synaphobranchus kaupii TaxID=118154 RepID=A0A9Q1IW59_SYNKA|nr:hypothetical protein SKAU_G00222300 [Synaphobranchus kaupii]
MGPGEDKFLGALNKIPACNMASSTTSGFVVVTQVCPQQSGTAAPAFCTIPQASPVLGQLLKGEPKALGTVQIMIGVMEILLGIIMAVTADSIANSLSLLCGIVFWGSLIYISSGALTVAANNKLNKYLVRGALGMNIFSAIAAGLTIITLSVDLFLLDIIVYYNHPCQAWAQGMKGVLLVFSILEIIVSICVSAFACRAVCDCSSQKVVYMTPTSSQVTSENLLIPTPHTYETAVLGQNVMGSMQTEKPPEYVETLP